MSYAKQHGYDFLYLQVVAYWRIFVNHSFFQLQEDIDGLVDEVYEKFGEAIYEQKQLNKLNLNMRAFYEAKPKGTTKETM